MQALDMLQLSLFTWLLNKAETVGSANSPTASINLSFGDGGLLESNGSNCLQRLTAITEIAYLFVGRRTWRKGIFEFS